MTTYEQARHIWPILVLAARNRQGLTAEVLAKLVACPLGELPQILAPIQSYCSVRDLPPLAIVVIPAKSGISGDGVYVAQEVPISHAAVFAFDWLSQDPPTPEMLEQAFRQQPNAGIKTEVAWYPRGGCHATIKDPCVVCAYC